MEFILMMVALFAIMYFLMIRPQQKKMRQDQEMRSALTPGDRVLLTSGIFATITHAGEKQFIVELAPDVQITVLKGSVARAVTPEDEEFEFTDEAVADEPGFEVPDDASALVDDQLTFDPTPDAEAEAPEADAPEGDEPETRSEGKN
ncbi:MAG: preprotein translocase subunit YajC [Arachnia sp.]